jgi:hypothetical protein
VRRGEGRGGDGSGGGRVEWESARGAVPTASRHAVEAAGLRDVDGALVHGAAAASMPREAAAHEAAAE